MFHTISVSFALLKWFYFNFYDVVSVQNFAQILYVQFKISRFQTLPKLRLYTLPIVVSFSVTLLLSLCLSLIPYPH